MIYFIVQPIGIMVEDLVIYGGKKVGLRDSGKWWCFVWYEIQSTELTSVLWSRRVGFTRVIVWFSRASVCA